MDQLLLEKVNKAMSLKNHHLKFTSPLRQDTGRKQIATTKPRQISQGLSFKPKGIDCVALMRSTTTC